MKKICVVTGTRADYGLLRWVMEGIRNSQELGLQVIATGMHLSPEFGLTYLEIENAVKSSGLKRTGINQKTWNEWQKNYGDIVSTLVLTYQEMNMKSEAELVLTSWLERNPGDINAKRIEKIYMATGNE